MDPSWLDLALLGRPEIPSRSPETLSNKYFGTCGLKIGAPQTREIQPRRIQPPIRALCQKAANVWKKDVWDFQAFSQTFLELRFSLGNEGNDGKNLNSQTWPGTPRRPSPRHLRPPNSDCVDVGADFDAELLKEFFGQGARRESNNYFTPKFRRPLKTTFDMTTLIFSTRACPSYPFYSFKGAPGTLFSWLVTENPSRKSPLKTTRVQTPERGTPPTKKLKWTLAKWTLRASQQILPKSLPPVGEGAQLDALACPNFLAPPLSGIIGQGVDAGLAGWCWRALS